MIQPTLFELIRIAHECQVPEEVRDFEIIDRQQRFYGPFDIKAVMSVSTRGSESLLG